MSLWREGPAPEIFQQAVKDFSYNKILPTIEKAIRQIRWGTSKELCNENEGKGGGDLAPGAFIPSCKRRKEKGCIVLNPNMLEKEGEILDFVVKNAQGKVIEEKSIARRQLVTPHEVLHMILGVLNLNRDIPIKTEHRWINRILELYFVDDPENWQLMGLTVEFEALLQNACGSLQLCDKWVAPQPEGALMPPPVPIAQPRPPDFNNDGVQDYFMNPSCMVTSAPCDSSPRLPVPRKSWEDVSPVILSSYAAVSDLYSTSSYSMAGTWAMKGRSKCPAPKVEKRITAWKWNDYDRQIHPGVHFFNTDRSMSFVPHQMVIRSGAAKPEPIDTILVYIDPSKLQQAGVTRILLADCALVPIDEVRWVIGGVTAFDMREALRLGASAEPLPDTAEGTMAQLVRGAKTILQTSGSPDRQRDAVLELARRSAMTAALPVHWEDSLLFALGLPQMPPPPLPKGRSAGCYLKNDPRRANK